MAMSKYSEKLEGDFNACPVHFEKTCEELSVYAHRTIQQNITRFCVTWLNHLATDWTIGVDGRNEASVNLAKDLYKLEEAREILNRGIPFI